MVHKSSSFSYQLRQMDCGHAQRSPGSCSEWARNSSSTSKYWRSCARAGGARSSCTKKKLEKRIAMLCICMCMMIITALCSKFLCDMLCYVNYFTIDRFDWAVGHAWCNQSAAVGSVHWLVVQKGQWGDIWVRNTNNTHKFTHSVTHIERVSEWVSGWEVDHLLIIRRSIYHLILIWAYKSEIRWVK